jgi:hypothetical protein
MSNVNKKAFAKKALTGAVLLATSPAWGKGDVGSQLGVNYLSIEIAPGAYCSVCADKSAFDGKTGSNITSNTMTVAVDPFITEHIELVFLVRDILAHDQDHVLFLLYSPQTSSFPQIPTPRSLYELKLDMSALEILAIYDISAQQMLAQPKTRIGTNSASHSIASFSVNLDSSILPTLIDNNEKVYLQAALLKKEYFDMQRYSEAILSDMDTLGFVDMTCPEKHVSVSVGLDPKTGEKVDPGTKTITDIDGNPLKTTVTNSDEANATVYLGRLGKDGDGGK